MNIQRLALVLTAVNLLLLIVNLGQFRPTARGTQDVLPVVRAHALQIVDAQGRERASILIHRSETVNGKTYPETVLLRMGDPNSEPGVKLTTSVDGSALGLSNGLQGGVQLYARKSLGSFVRVIEKDGQQQLLKP
jgi:hypothetical protein